MTTVNCFIPQNKFEQTRRKVTPAMAGVASVIARMSWLSGENRLFSNQSPNFSRTRVPQMGV